jgi:AcrR family transcriptional regulator
VETAKIRRGRKFDQVLLGARSVFLRDGFEGASVDDIAREARVSKATLYSYFPDKRLLFMEVARSECRRQAEAALHLIDPGAPAAVVLRAAAEHIVAFMISDFGQRIFRICVAEADRFPALGAEFYQSGPMLAREKLGAYLRLAAARGELAITDFDLAADQFAELCRANIHAKLIFGIAPTPTGAEIDRTITGAVETFLARYGTSRA